MSSKIALGIALCSLALLVALCLPRRWRLLSLTVVLFLFPAGGLFGLTSSALFSVIIFSLSLDSIRKVQRFKVTIVLLATAVWFAVCAIWSPDSTEALNAVSSVLGWVTCIALTFDLLASGESHFVKRIVQVIGFLVAIESLSTILFRLSPATEEAYYTSRASTLLLGPVSANVYGDATLSNNVADPERAGGFLFVNCNQASMTLGVASLLFIAVWLLLRDRWAAMVAVISVAGIIAANSKTGYALVVVLPVTSVLVAVASGKVSASRVVGVAFAVLVTSGIAFSAVLTFGDEFVDASEQTLVPRLALWNEAWRAIAELPILGLGFGGWLQRWYEGDVLLYFQTLPRPPHNLLLATWMNAGVPAVILLSILWVTVAKLGSLTLRSSPPIRQRLAYSAILMTFVWVCIHGMGDNTAVWGVSQSIPLLGFGLALLLATGAGISWRDVRPPAGGAIASLELISVRTVVPAIVKRTEGRSR